MSTMQIDRGVVEQAMGAMLNFDGDISDEMFESIRSLRAALAERGVADCHPPLQAEQAPTLLDALKFAEAALADIGDADREPGDDLAWCEARAAKALPRVRQAIRTAEGRN